MSAFSRRTFIATGLAGASVSVMPVFTQEANAAAALMTRYNLKSANGLAMLKKYAQAVKIMMAAPANSPLSWTFQWYTHAVPSNTTKTAQLNAIFGTGSSPAKTLATQMWDTCQAHFNPANEPYFLPWHRMYVCFFEMIIRKVLNDNTFTLPYWNYSVPAGYALPAEFRMPGDPNFGSLFRPNRRQPVNAGQPIYTGIGLASDLSPASAIAQTSYLPSGPNPGFNQALDQGLHGLVHVFVGNSQGMGQIPWAANDPVFWMHHCNIDRLWVRWNASPHANPGTVAWGNQTFVFANTAGQGVKAVVKDYTDTVKCNYRYDQIEVVTSPVLVSSLASPAVTAAAPVTVAVPAVAGAVAVGREPVRVSLRRAAAAGPSPDATGPLLASRLDALPEQRRIYLIINNLSASLPPEALYRVYLDLPEGRPDDPLNRHYVGTFNFFDAVPHGEDHSAHGSKAYTFDITEVAANLRAQNLLKTEHTVTIVPFGQPAADAQTMIGDISIVEQ